MSTYPGGKRKSGVYQTLINMIPPHNSYIEPFLGGGAIMRFKRPANSQFGVDADLAVIQMWHEHNKFGVTHLHIEQGDGLEWIAGHRLYRDDFLYLDPPYLMSTRSTKERIYKHEFATETEHAKLLKLIKGLRCMVMISGYYSPLYARRLERWRCVSFQSTNRAGKPTTEYVWMNYPEPLELHDYRYLGRDYREREAIKKLQNRWLAKFARMPVTKQYAILAVLQQRRLAQHAPSSEMVVLQGAAASIITSADTTRSGGDGHEQGVPGDTIGSGASGQN